MLLVALSNQCLAEGRVGVRLKKNAHPRPCRSYGCPYISVSYTSMVYTEPTCRAVPAFGRRDFVRIVKIEACRCVVRLRPAGLVSVLDHLRGCCPCVDYFQRQQHRHVVSPYLGEELVCVFVWPSNGR